MAKRLVKKTSDFIILACTAFLVLTLFFLVNFVKSGKKTSLVTEASNFTRQADGTGTTAHVEFKLQIRDSENENVDKGFARIKTLSSDDEIKNAMVQATNISWGSNTAFITGPVKIVYSDGRTSNDYNVRMLVVDQDELNPDPNPYQDVFAVILCKEDDCTTPWMPWSVEEGNIVIK